VRDEWSIEGPPRPAFMPGVKERKVDVRIEQTAAWGSRSTAIDPLL
jgi:hypothetical protein